MTLSCEIKHVCRVKSKYIDILLVFTYNRTFCSNLEVDLQIKFSSHSCGFNWKYWCLAFLSFQHLSFLIYKSVNKIYSWLELFNLDNFCQEFLTYFCFTRTRSCRFKNSFPISDIEDASYWMKQFKMLSGTISRYLDGIQLNFQAGSQEFSHLSVMRLSPVHSVLREEVEPDGAHHLAGAL